MVGSLAKTLDTAKFSFKNNNSTYAEVPWIFEMVC